MYGDLNEAPSQGVNSTIHQLFNKHHRVSSNDIELQPNSIDQSTNENAIFVRNAYKNFGCVRVLEGLNMTVPKGAIYTLLGASGCGKTTLLSCITGRKLLNSGDVHVLCQKIGTACISSRLGFMPQETGLYGEFTIRETLLFFGRVMGMKKKKIEERTEYLINLLMLPQSDQTMNDLSGGQQRRVSLAVAFLHQPELLILDEPTVGADSILRHIIWDHFLNITKNRDVTIVITTHYIEEARQGNLIGLMRGGCLMAEDPPETLIKQHNTKTLEEVFLKLSIHQNLKGTNHSNIATGAGISAPINPYPILKDIAADTKSVFKVFALSHMNALVRKNVLWLRKNLLSLTMIVLLPVFLVSLFCVAIGHDPVNLPVAIVNFETENGNCNTSVFCESKEISCSYIHYLEKQGLVMKYYNTHDEAIDSVQTGVTHASIIIKQNYSSALLARARNWQSANQSDMDYSTIDVFRDLSNKHLAINLQFSLYEAYQEFFYEYIASCGIRADTMRIPMMFEPIYGKMRPNFTDFSIPPLLLSVTFIIGVLLTAWAMFVERNEASLERLLVMGINQIELLTAHIIVELGIMLIQTVLIMICAFIIFNMTLKGSLVLTGILLGLTGLCGICYGLLVSCLTNSLIGIALIGIGSYFTVILTSGFIWPTEGMHPLLKPFAIFFPLTKPTDSLRNILHRDWGFLNQDVYVGFFSITAWTLIFLLISIVLIKLQRN